MDQQSQSRRRSRREENVGFVLRFRFELQLSCAIEYNTWIHFTFTPSLFVHRYVLGVVDNEGDYNDLFIIERKVE